MSLVELAVSLVVAVVATLAGAWGLLSWFQRRNESYVDKAEARLTAAVTGLRGDFRTSTDEHQTDIAGLRHEFKGSLDGLRSDLTSSVDTLGSDVRALTSRLDTVITQQAESARALYSAGERLQAQLSSSLQEFRSMQRQADERLATLWAEREARG